MVANTDIFSRSESNVRSYCRSYPTVFDRAQGSHLYDLNNMAYLDFLSGAGSLNYGHNEPDILASVISYLTRSGVVMGLDKHTKAKADFIASMNESILRPRRLDYKLQFTSPSGTSAIESAVKLARKYTGRRNIVAFTNGFHGMTSVALGLTGSRFNRQNLSAADITRLPYDGYMGSGVNTVAYFRRLLEDGSSGLDMPAAVVVETVQGEGGLNLASSEWLAQLSTLCKHYQILLILDDIQAGCGRTGRFFSFERANIAPDLVCLSKSIGGMGLPLALVLLKPHLDVWEPGEDNGTFRGNNLAFVAATKMIEKYWSNTDFEAELEAKAQLLNHNLLEAVSLWPEHIIRKKGIGCIQGLEFTDSEVVKQVKTACFQNGLIIESCGATGQVLKLMPPLNITHSDLQSGLSIIGASLRSVLENGAQPQLKSEVSVKINQY